VSTAQLEDALLQAHGDDRVCIDTVEKKPCVFIKELWQQEKIIAQILMDTCAKPLEIDPQLQEIVDEVLAQENLPLSEEQQAAILSALKNRVFVLTGGPGVGKTTLIKLLVQIFGKQKLEVVLAAPTGRAAKRISEATGQTAKTIHRLLEYDPYTKTFGFHAGFPIPADVIILDESSMLDVPLAFAIVSALSEKGRIIFVGDIDQLAPVGPGDVLNALIKSGKIPSFSLKTIFRQAQTSQIIVNAHRVNQGLMPEVNKEVLRDFYLIRVKENEQQQKVVSIVSEQLPARFGYCPMNDIQVLTPMNGGHLGVDTLNEVLQEKLNPAQKDKDEVKHNRGFLRQGDKVIQIVNNYDKNVFNGDIGTVESIKLEQETCQVMFDNRIVDYEFKEIDQLKLAYAISVHKSQGSEYKAIVVVLSMSQQMMLKRNLLYTAMTRAKSCAVVVSEPRALAIAVERSEVNKRVSKLEEWLQNYEHVEAE
jgi:exodeoxyribonuclease V alpha subunit